MPNLHLDLKNMDLEKLSFKPISKKRVVYIKTFGCSLNQSDSETMAGVLTQNGYEIITSYGKEKNTDIINKVDAVIINTCSVKNLAESKFFHELKKWQTTDDVKII